MYAVINTGGKQYRLTEGDLLEVERLEGEVGDEVVFDEVLMLGGSDEPLVGSPQIEGAQVVGKIVEQKKGDKVIVFKYKRRKMYRRKAGHRQLLTTVKIETIEDGSSAPKKEKKEAAPKSSDKAEKPAEKKVEASEKPKAEAKKADSKKVESKKAEAKKAKPEKTAAKTKKAASKKSTQKDEKASKGSGAQKNDDDK